MIIEDLNVKHLDGVLNIEKESYDDPWNYEHFLYEIHNHHSKSLVILSDDLIVNGYVITHQIIDQIFILNLAVAKTVRKNGFATMLLNHLFKYAKDLNVHKIDLEVRISNSNALSLYRKEHFNIVGERKNFYSDGETAILMCKLL
jgi:ribosomal-protein-alanine N-acetyltransferase